jgi:DNA polymerase/3'-5' exonuclease PolX
MMNNRQLADTFTLIANLSEIKGEIIYKTLAYRKASESLMSLRRATLTEMKLKEPELAATFHEFAARLLSERLTATTRTLEAVLK